MKSPISLTFQQCEFISNKLKEKATISYYKRLMLYYEQDLVPDHVGKFIIELHSSDTWYSAITGSPTLVSDKLPLKFVLFSLRGMNTFEEKISHCREKGVVVFNSYFEAKNWVKENIKDLGCDILAITESEYISPTGRQIGGYVS